MRKSVDRIRHYVILDSDRSKYRRYLGSTVSLCRTKDEITKLDEQGLERLTWISFARDRTDDLLKAVAGSRAKLPRRAAVRDECVLTIAAPRVESVPLLHGLFARIIGDSPRYRWLPKDELNEVLFDSGLERSELFIAGAADMVTQTLCLVRGNCQQVVVPFSSFPVSGDGTAPDFTKLRLTDHGRTVALGDYEAAADVILYETDPDYRKKLNRKRRDSERSFGASLSRLRKQRRLGRSDFAPLSAKTIARIERNEIGKPHGKTLQAIADRLGVLAAEIGDY
jgi:hypothetical protein